jgi:hypothetical protein
MHAQPKSSTPEQAMLMIGFLWSIGCETSARGLHPLPQGASAARAQIRHPSGATLERPFATAWENHSRGNSPCRDILTYPLFPGYGNGLGRRGGEGLDRTAVSGRSNRLRTICPSKAERLWISARDRLGPGRRVRFAFGLGLLWRQTLGASTEAGGTPASGVST